MENETANNGPRSVRRAYSLLGAVVAIFAIVLGPSTLPAAADTPAHTDVMLLFDTSGSMGTQLTEAKEEIEKVETQVSATLPDVQFGVAEVKDFPESEEEVTTETPWKLDQPITSDSSKVKTAIEPLTAGGGGDSPESYGRALWETDTNPNVGWRASARHVIILVADDVPHDDNLNEGLPEATWVVPSPWSTGEEKPGTWKIPGTLWTTSVNRNFQTTLTELASDGKPLGMVDFRGSESGYLPYWEYWAGLTGGQALLAGSGELATKVATLITTRATASLPACPAGQIRNAASVCFTPHPTVTQVICNLVIATATDTCTATIGDGAPAGATNPTGSVSFKSATGGLFFAGGTCALTPTPMSGNVSSCSVQFLPPTSVAKFPEITATYTGDEVHLSSKGETHYGPASSLAEHVDLSEAGTVNPNGTVEIPVDCGFPCEIEGGLTTLPDLASLSSVADPLATEASVVASFASKHKGKKKKKTVLLGKGKVKLSTAGKKGKLVIKPTAKGKRALRGVHGKGLRLTIKFTINTLNHTLVATKTKHVKVRPAKKKSHKHH